MSASQGSGAESRSRASLPRCLALSWCVIAAAAGLLLFVSCGGRQHSPSGTPAVQATGTAPRTNPAPEARGVRLSPVPRVTPSGILTLTVWGPDFMAPLPDAPGGPVLADQIRAFAEAHPGWQVQYVRKKPYGQGGLVHFLRSTQAVAPELLPDLVLLDMREVGLAAQTSLPQPLEPLLGMEIVSDLAPFAREAGQVGNHLLAAQYEADLRFLAYNSAIIERPPATWAEILASQATYLLPIGNSEGAVRDAFLPQYLAAGGKLADRDGLPYLDETVVTAILEVYQSARQADLLPAAGFDLDDASDCWPIYLTSRAAMTNVNSWDYGRERANRLATTRVGPLPTLSGTWSSVSDGWGWALLCKDLRRQAAAVEFLRAILRPEAMAAWSRVTYHLPTRRSALPLAVADAEYLGFLQRLMDVTVPEPGEPIYTLSTEPLRSAIDDVTRGRLSPEAAASQAVDRVRAAREELRTRSQP